MGKQLRVGVAGIGFIGQVHIRAARLAGAQVVAVSGGNPDKTRALAASLGIDDVRTSEDLATALDIDVLHICTPNHLHAQLAELALRNGKHVVCEKPLATSAADAAALTAVAEETGLVNTVPFVYRFHPVAREARARVSSGESGAVRLLHGSYLQDWLALPSDYSWRVDPALGGASQAFADIGSHWCDLTEFISGHRITRLSARTITAVPERLKENVDAFAKSTGSGERITVQNEDAVAMMFETDQGAAGTLMVSQVSHGRKNRLWIEVDATEEAITFDQEDVEHLWIGRRAGATLLNRDPGVLHPDAARYATLPAGHAQGYDGCFDAFVSDTYAVVDGEERDGLPRFADGLRAATITDTVLRSAKSNQWEEVQI